MTEERKAGILLGSGAGPAEVPQRWRRALNRPQPILRCDAEVKGERGEIGDITLTIWVKEAGEQLSEQSRCQCGIENDADPGFFLHADAIIYPRSKGQAAHNLGVKASHRWRWKVSTTHLQPNCPSYRRQSISKTAMEGVYDTVAQCCEIMEAGKDNS